MTITRFSSSVAVLAILALTACGDRQDPADDAQPGADQSSAMSPFGQMDPDAEAAMSELQQIHQRLQPVHQEAMQDPAISAQFTQIQGAVEGAMREGSPGLFERIEKVQADVQAAQDAGDTQRLQTIAMESQGLQMEAQAAEAAAVSRPAIQEQIQSFEQDLRQRMISIDPEAGDLLDRSKELQDELRAKQEQAMGHPGQP